MALFLITVLVFVFVIFIMAIGVIVGKRRISGSCGGLGNCEFCLHKDKEQCEHNMMCQGSAETEEELASGGERVMD